MPDFAKFFKQATTGRQPYPYQRAFAEANRFPTLLDIPTGCGKTACAILGWLYRRMVRPDHTPRRLVYCLPMRVLVEQTEREAKTWIDNLKRENPDLDVPVHVLMGGVEAEKWHLRPESSAILIGTQDMLLSRALNRGYAASRFHWTIDFGLLNNDCLWVFDEPQLMGSGVSTSAQLAGLREALGVFGDCPTTWMSATLEPSWLETVDFAGKFSPKAFGLTAQDEKEGLKVRLHAAKSLHSMALASPRPGDLAKAVVERHEKGTQTLVVLNTVDRAKAVYGELAKLQKKNPDAPSLLLVHSRFRPKERKVLNEELQKGGDAARDRIIVATQVVEAGVDISCRTLITELAPWASVVQRIGRCNRTGTDGPGQVFWIDLDTPKHAAPYEPVDLEFAREQLTKLEGRGVSPQALDDFKRAEAITLPFGHKHVLRRRDLLDLFDTAPDLSGNDIDIQRFVRGDDPDIDVQVFWRDVTVENWDASPQRDELCSVPVGSLKEFLKKSKAEAFVWDHLDEEWRAVRAPERELRPGLTILLPATAGGYSELGWDPDNKSAVSPLTPARKETPEAAGSDRYCETGKPIVIADHTDNVCRHMADLLKAVGAWLGDWHGPLTDSARWHDAGKALPVGQKALHGTDNPDPSRLLAKSGRKGRLDYGKFGRKYFRHELGSALAVLQQRADAPFVVAYLIATHHGRVRLAIRALPGEDPPDDPLIRFALGIRDGDGLPGVDLGDGEVCPATELDLSPMQLGGDGSWTARALRLLSELGPFKLAYLEAILRAADARASQEEAKNA
ncbi:MAG: CRISPR-associated helicase Cas3' [Planctomycetaceae bacterium]